MNVEIFHGDYAPEHERTWHLSYWLSPDTYAWCVHERSTGHLMALVSGDDAELPAEHRIPLHPASVSFTVMPEVSTLIPRTSLPVGTRMEHLKLVHGHVPSGLLRDEPLSTLGAQCIYLHDEEAERFVLGRHPSARSLPLNATLVNHALAHSVESGVLVLHRTPERLDLVIARNGHLLLSNTFHAVSAEDVLYYALFVVKECGLAPAGVTLRAGGTHLSTSEQNLLWQYFNHGPVPSTGKDEPVLKRLSVPNAYRWTGLIEQYPCAS